MLYKLLALDMDGTLLTSDKRISPHTQEALKSLSTSGTPVAYCTGRCVKEMLDYPSELPFIRYGVLSSGAVVYDFAQDEALEVRPLNTDLVVRAMELAAPQNPMVHLMAVNESAARPDDIQRMDCYGMGIYQPMFEKICTADNNLVSWVRAHEGEVVKLNFYHTDSDARSRTRHALERAGLPLTLVHAEKTSLECSALGMSKGAGLCSLAAHLGITPAEVVAVGDSDNDIEALKAVGMPVAMGNATEQILRLSRLVVADNDHDGISQVVDKLF